MSKSKTKEESLADALRKENARKTEAPPELGDWREYGSGPRPAKKGKDRALPLRNSRRG